MINKFNAIGLPPVFGCGSINSFSTLTMLYDNAMVGFISTYQSQVIFALQHHRECCLDTHQPEKVIQIFNPFMESIPNFNSFMKVYNFFLQI